MSIMNEKDSADIELLIFSMTLINKTLNGIPDQDTYYDVCDVLEEQGMGNNCTTRLTQFRNHAFHAFAPVVFDTW